MRRNLATAAVTLGVLLGAGSGVAAADTPTQAAQQAAGTFQSAGSSASSTQVAPSNSAISVRIGSPGSNGSVSQSNGSVAGAAAGNLAATGQQASQTGGGVQAADQVAKTIQAADAAATSTQVHPSNSAISVRIGSPGDDGSVRQSNDSAALAAAGNAAHTTQTATQDAAGGGSGQAVQQQAGTGQSANADATSKQVAPSNSAISVRIHSPGGNGSVDQSNSSGALAAAGNAAETTQTATQDPHGSCGCGGGTTQAAGQFADTRQSADAGATSEQVHPSNSATSVRIASPGDDGDVSQSNASFAGSLAGNAAETTQTADQAAGSGHGAGVQALDQEAATLQHASSDATSEQVHPSNDATSVRIGSPGSDGSVDQSNTSAALSLAGNLAGTTQDASQSQSPSGCGCGGDRVQAIGQFATTGQWAGSNALSKQVGASNSATPVGIGGEHSSPCGCGDAAPAYRSDAVGTAPAPGGGPVRQANGSAALSGAVNLAGTDQSADQEQGSGREPCGCSGAGVQAAGQFATTGQWAGADATSTQLWPSNAFTPVRIGSGGSGGSVEQANRSLAAALALNAALTRQSVTQRQ